MKVCGVCGCSKPLSEFNRKGEGYQYRCRECQRNWYKQYYDSDPREKERLRRNRVELYALKRKIINDAKNKQCMDCHQSYPTYVMDFDHREPSQKEFTISRVALMSVKQLIIEIKKCDVVCSNCHRERTWGSIDDNSDDMLY